MKLLVFLIVFAGCATQEKYGRNATANITSATQENLRGSVTFTHTQAGLQWRPMWKA